MGGKAETIQNHPHNKTFQTAAIAERRQTVSLLSAGVPPQAGTAPWSLSRTISLVICPRDMEELRRHHSHC